MTPFEEVLPTILSALVPLPAERVDLGQARGRFLAEPIASDRDLPLFDNSQMDGFAVRSEDLAAALPSNPVTLRRVGASWAGHTPGPRLEAGEVRRIATGAAVPEGADAVVMQEEVEATAEAVTFREPTEPGAFVRRRGEDIRSGETPLQPGQRLGATELAVAAAIGRTALLVHRRPRVALLSTGDELVDPGRPGLVDSNAIQLSTRLAELGFEVTRLGVAADSLPALIERFEAARGCDVLITTAGVSVGDRDHVRSALAAAGFAIRIERVAIRPGKPFLFAQREGGLPGLLFGLPGNPVSARVTFETFVVPALRRLAGGPMPGPRRRVRLAERVDPPTKLTVLSRVHLTAHGARLTDTQSSGYLRSLLGADGLVILPAGAGPFEAGREVELLPLE